MLWVCAGVIMYCMLYFHLLLWQSRGTQGTQEPPQPDWNWGPCSPTYKCQTVSALPASYLCFSRDRLGSTLVASPSRGEPEDVGDEGGCLFGVVDGESFRVGKEGAGGVRGDSFRMGEEGKEGEGEEVGDEGTSVLWLQFFCLRVCCCCWCCCRPEVEPFSLQSTASNWAEWRRNNISLL